MKKSRIHFVIILFALSMFGQALESGGVELVRLKYGGGGDWYNGPSELPNLADFARGNTGMNIVSRGKHVEPMSEELFLYPFLFMTGHGNVSFSREEAARLRTYLENGGFLFVDDDYGLDESFRKEIAEVFPDKELVELPFSHPVFDSPYNFPNGLPKIHEHDEKPAQAFGIFHEGRLVLLYSYESNVSDGWDDESVHGNPPEIRQKALKMGTNILVFALSN